MQLERYESLLDRVRTAVDGFAQREEQARADMGNESPVLRVRSQGLRDVTYIALISGAATASLTCDHRLAKAAGAVAACGTSVVVAGAAAADTIALERATFTSLARMAFPFTQCKLALQEAAHTCSRYRITKPIAC